jgi:hypothetical protein
MVNQKNLCKYSRTQKTPKSGTLLIPSILGKEFSICHNNDCYYYTIKGWAGQVTVAHTCNPRYSETEIRRIAAQSQPG